MAQTSSFRDIMIGSLCVALGQVCFAVNDVLIKLSKLNLSQVMIGKLMSQFIIAVVWWICFRPKNYQKKNWYGDQPFIFNIWMRGFVISISTICYYYGIIRLPIGDAQCIFYQSPITIAIMGRIFLKEKLPKSTPLICLFGIIGIILMSQPLFIVLKYKQIFNIETSESVEPLNIDGVISMFIAIFAWSICCLLVRTAKNTHFLQLEIVCCPQILIVMTSTLIFNNFITHNKFIGDLNVNNWSFDVLSIVIILIMGLFGFGSIAFSVIGYQYGDSTKVSWLEYSILVFGFSSQILIFNDTPNEFEIIGLILVVFACCLSLFEELYKRYSNKQKISFQSISSSDSETYWNDI